MAAALLVAGCSPCGEFASDAWKDPSLMRGEGLVQIDADTRTEQPWVDGVRDEGYPLVVLGDVKLIVARGYVCAQSPSWLGKPSWDHVDLPYDGNHFWGGGYAPATEVYRNGPYWEVQMCGEGFLDLRSGCDSENRYRTKDGEDWECVLDGTWQDCTPKPLWAHLLPDWAH